MANIVFKNYIVLLFFSLFFNKMVWLYDAGAAESDEIY